MRAVRYDGTGLYLSDIPAPVAGPGQVVLEVTAAGLCHSDLAVMSRPPEALPYKLPITLGHEAVGVVVDVGAGISGLAEGDTVAVYGPHGCGACRTCRSGAENHCPHARAAGILPPGLGADGALADYLLVPHSRHLVPLRGLHPVRAAPLTDAGLTSYHAVRSALPRLPPDGTALLIGIGGLGHLAVQILRALSSAQIIAVDMAADKRELALRCGADTALPSTDTVPDQVRDLTEGVGADVVFDFVASDATLRMAARSLRPGGEISIVGVGEGRLPVAVNLVPLGAVVRTPYWGTQSDLVDVLALAREGRITVEVEEYALEETPLAYERLARGNVRGRAVVNPARAPGNAPGQACAEEQRG
nr:NAD(P)-dependent alcohol dehydrogenase [Thermobifida fusca]PZN63105.1 MAG: alcohol dehydrogenase [Thermobifida fusca]